LENSPDVVYQVTATVDGSDDPVVTV